MLEPSEEDESVKIIDVPLRGLYPTERKKIEIFGRRFSFCEIILFALLITTFLVLIGLSIALAAANGRQDANSNSRSPAMCQSRDCLWAAAFLLNNMNSAADPCDDFFSYVCGNFPVAHPRSDNSIDLTVFKVR